MTTVGEQLRIDGIEANLAAAAALNRPYREHAELILADFARRQAEFTADDVRRLIPDGVEPHSHNVLPSLIRVWAARGAIQAVGWVRSTRPSRHASVNRMWRGVGGEPDTDTGAAGPHA